MYHSGRGCWSWERQLGGRAAECTGRGEISVPSAQYCYEPKMAPKNSLLKNSYKQNRIMYSFMWLTYFIYRVFLRFSPFYCWGVLHCMDNQHFCLFVHQVMYVSIVSSSGYYESRYYKHSHTSFYVGICFYFRGGRYLGVELT